MTKPQSLDRSKRTVPSKALQNHIAGLLADKPRTVDEIETLTGFSVFSVRRRLEALAELDLAHSQRVIMKFGFHLLWHPGPAPVGGKHDVNAAKPVQVTVRRYPPVARRDPLVAALFGAAPAMLGS